MRRWIKELLPPLLLRYLRRLKHRRYGWLGNYASWEDAQHDAGSYDNEKIIEKVYDALKQVKEGVAVYERDGVLFDTIEYSWPLLSGLLYAASRTQGMLHVLDFGGSLGSTYFQNKKFLDGLKDVSWSVVEQKHFVDLGIKAFETTTLKFFYDIETCVARENPNVLLLSSVLQYLGDPYEFLHEALTYDFEYIIIDLTPFSKSGKERICVQHVPPQIYEASYPCWIFAQDTFNAFFESNYDLVEEFHAMPELVIYLSENDEAIYKGFIYQRKKR